MVPISKQPKEKIQAIIESCSRQFPEFQERSRKRIRTYLKSCRRMKKGGFEVQTVKSLNVVSMNLLCSCFKVHNLADPCRQIRPTPPHLTSAMAENILAAACDSESRNAAKRMRLDVYQATVNYLAACVNLPSRKMFEGALKLLMQNCTAQTRMFCPN